MSEYHSDFDRANSIECFNESFGGKMPEAKPDLNYEIQRAVDEADALLTRLQETETVAADRPLLIANAAGLVTQLKFLKRQIHRATGPYR